MAESRRSTLLSILNAQIDQAERAEHHYFCERCRAFVSSKRCRFRHKGRYWSLADVERLRDKLSDDRSLGAT